MIQATCPHCGIQNNAFSIAHTRPWAARQNIITSDDLMKKETKRVSASSYCISCNNPVGFVLSKTDMVSTLMNFNATIESLITKNSGIEALGYAVESVHPANVPHRIPQHLPPHVAKAFDQGEQNFKFNNPDAAIAMYAKALEAGLRWRFPGIKGMLNEMIGTLKTKGLLPPEIGDWAHQVRLVRKDAVHDGDELEADDMEAGRNFADAVLRYTITLPTDVALRRGLPAESILPDWTPPSGGE